jgi:hypothetical protein
MNEEPLFTKMKEESEQRKKFESTLDLEKLLKGEIDEG